MSFLGDLLSERSLWGRLDDVQGDAGYESGEHPPRMGFFTDTSVCIGCKACEVACKEWNDVPEDGYLLTGMSYDNTAALGASTWRHVAFVEQASRPGTADLGMPGVGPPVSDDQGAPSGDGSVRWLMASDVCKHCTHAGCLDVCPTGALFRTEFGTVVVQPDVCNGCGYCVSACPYGVIDLREGDGRAFKCTLCYDRLKDGQTPACAQACPTESIQFGEVGELRQRARLRLAELHDKGLDVARLYGADPDDGVGGDGAFFLLLDEPEVYGLPPDPVVPTRSLGSVWKHVGYAAATLAGLGAASFLGRKG
jgi:formate dehydrogenase iron-sulfur subunit